MSWVPNNNRYDNSWRDYHTAFIHNERHKYLVHYDSHNPGDRMSNDVGRRTYGSCGCGVCAEVREREQFGNLPMNDQRRETHGMASVNMCERCDAVMVGRAVGSVLLVLSSDPDTYEQIKKELCPGCVEDLLLLVEVRVPAKQPSYRDGYKRPEKDAPGVGELGGVDLEALLAEALQRAMKANRAIEGKSTVIEHD